MGVVDLWSTGPCVCRDGSPSGHPSKGDTYGSSRTERNCSDKRNLINMVEKSTSVSVHQYSRLHFGETKTQQINSTVSYNSRTSGN